MVNIPNTYPTLFGGPLFDEENNAVGMLFPFNDKLLGTHMLAVPSNYLEGILSQFKQGEGEIRRPHIGMSIKSSSSGEGAFVLRVSSDGPAQVAGVKLGDTILEINDQKITNNSDFFKCVGYRLGETLKLKLENGGKYRYVTIKTT
jgi:S1-C subfamily serine protease